LFAFEQLNVIICSFTERVVTIWNNLQRVVASFIESHYLIVILFDNYVHPYACFTCLSPSQFSFAFSLRYVNTSNSLFLGLCCVFSVNWELVMHNVGHNCENTWWQEQIFFCARWCMYRHSLILILLLTAVCSKL